MGEALLIERGEGRAFPALLSILLESWLTYWYLAACTDKNC